MQNNYESTSAISEEATFSFTDSFVGIITEPSITFTGISKLPASTKHWLIPVILYILTSIISTFVLYNVQSIRLDQKLKTEARLQKMVEDGKISQEAADQQSVLGDKMFNTPFFYITTSVTGSIATLFWFFVASAFFMLFVKSLLHGHGGYRNAMIAFGLPIYVLIIQNIFTTIISLLMGKFVQSTSIATFMSLDTHSFVYFFLNKLDLFSIWFYALVSVGFAKFFNSSSTKKYFILVFSIWISFGLLIFLISKYVPFFQNFS